MVQIVRSDYRVVAKTFSVSSSSSWPTRLILVWGIDQIMAHWLKMKATYSSNQAAGCEEGRPYVVLMSTVCFAVWHWAVHQLCEYVIVRWGLDVWCLYHPMTLSFGYQGIAVSVRGGKAHYHARSAIAIVNRQGIEIENVHSRAEGVAWSRNVIGPNYAISVHGPPWRIAYTVLDYARARRTPSLPRLRVEVAHCLNATTFSAATTFNELDCFGLRARAIYQRVDQDDEI